jgi:DNA topoisomerase I
MWILIGSGLNKDKQWTVLQHNGPYFPPEYEPHNIPIKINNEVVKLESLAEEYATLYAHYIDTTYVENPKFNKNFLKDFKKVLPSEYSNLNDINVFDFRDIKKFLVDKKEERLALSKEEKEKMKEDNEKLEKPYKFCIIDGMQQKVGNYKIEPPGIFLGRGNHPKIGRIKKRIYPKDVTINLSKDATIPKPNIKNNDWGEVIHNQEVIWLATWKDNITEKNKYVFLSMESTFKSKSDEDKFDLARRLKKIINKIRTTYTDELKNNNLEKSQLATALYFIDNLALRVGGKKTKQKEKADTVGVTSLRVEHIDLIEPNTIKLDFLGKDSIRYCNKVKVSNEVFENIKKFTKNKNKKDQLFDKISSSTMNNYLNSYMEGLTAKVWRTFNASNLFQKELDKIKPDKIMSNDENERINILIALFNQANSEVAILCNHQKNVGKGYETQIEKINDMIKKLKKDRDNYKKKSNSKKVTATIKKIKKYKLKKETKIKMKNVSLGTSKTNYIDPRIIFSFIKRFNIPKDKLFTKVLLDRFQWASQVDETFKF